MGLIRSLSTGASALQANQTKFDVISNNLANSSTTGFKLSRANFATQFSQIYTAGTGTDDTNGIGTGGTNPYQVGLGVTVGSTQQSMKQGTIENTDRPLDMAISGDGFFVYAQNGIMNYSRSGAVTQDTEGNLVDSNTGAFLQGYNVQIDANGNTIQDSNGVNQLSGKMENLTISSDTISQPKQTQNITMKGNLNAAADDGTVRTTSMNVYDRLGTVRTMTFNFTKTANDNEYSLTTAIDGNSFGAATNVTFNSDGTLNTPQSLTLNASDLNTAIGSNAFDATTPSNITVTLADSNNLAKSLTQYSAASTASFNTQDGYTSGDLSKLSVDEEGKVWGEFSNGRSEVLGQVVLAKFTNPEGLVSNGSNYFSVSPNSGVPTYGTAGDAFQSTSIAGSALEMSNVDITTQFTEMISTQRAFEAASRTVTVSDTLLGEITQLKR